MSAPNAPVSAAQLQSRILTETLAYGTAKSMLIKLEVRYCLQNPAHPEYVVSQLKTHERFSQLVTRDLDHAVDFYNSLIQPKGPTT